MAEDEIEGPVLGWQREWFGRGVFFCNGRFFTPSYVNWIFGFFFHGLLLATLMVWIFVIKPAFAHYEGTQFYYTFPLCVAAVLFYNMVKGQLTDPGVIYRSRGI